MSVQMPERKDWYALSAAESAAALGVSPEKGLSSAEAQQRLQQAGPNVLDAGKQESRLRAFLRQYQDFMQIMLLAAAAVNWIVTRETGLTLLLVVLTIFNAWLGLRGEAKAEASLASLQKMMRTVARVRRDGQPVEIDASEIVPGDIVLVEAGNVIPADGRLFVAANLEIEEAALTGESTASSKNLETLPAGDVPLGDRANSVFMNTSVTRGRGEFIATGTGMSTEMGHIAALLNRIEPEKTPLQKQMDRLVILIAIMAGITFVLMFILGLSKGQSFTQIFVAGVALAISAIPTGMPATVTTLYSIGTIALAKQNAIVKRLPSVETLGSVSAICSDKTGTLTLNKMTARELVIPGVSRYSVSGEGYSIEGTLRNDGSISVDLRPFLLPMALCADARLDGENLIGDPTEGALIVLAEKGGIDVDAARVRFPRVAEIPFDSDYKYMATFHRMPRLDGNGEVIRAFVKGAPDVLIARGKHYYTASGDIIDVNDATRQIALDENARMAAAGERVMVIAAREFDPETFDPTGDLFAGMEDLVLLAMVGIVDPPRPEARDAIAACKDAGIRVRMITGDHVVTAAAIGKELGIPGKALTGAEFAAMDDATLKAELPEIGIVARVAPEDKIRMVKTLQELDQTVSMTGDGVNDAPALKQADIGVAMGITGTEVSKDAAVMILTDDNFATIVKAVGMGRAIYDNLTKYVRFQMVSLVAFIFTYLGAIVVDVVGGVPFSPQVVLWINFFVQTPLAIMLGLAGASSDLMARRPRLVNQPVVSRQQWVRFIVIGLVMSIFTLILLKVYEEQGLAVSATMAFVGFSLMSVATALNVQSENGSLFTSSTRLDNRQLSLLAISLASIFLPTVISFLQRIFGLVELTLNQWLLCIALALVLTLVEELYKFVMRRRVGSPAAQVATA